MPTVSENYSTRFIKLDKQIGCEYVCAQVQALIQDAYKNNSELNECLLTLEIKPISYTTDKPPPRLTEGGKNIT